MVESFVLPPLSDYAMRLIRARSTAPTCYVCPDSNCFLRTEDGYRELICPVCLNRRPATAADVRAILGE